ncbi:MAG: alpha/beta hydrolase [Gammaproteobacteria bacterium]
MSRCRRCWTPTPRSTPNLSKTLSAAEARRQPTLADAVKRLLEQQGKSTAPEPVGDVQDRSIEGPGGSIPIRIYTPKGDGPFPVVFYIHGGGWVLADLDTYDASARALTNAARVLLVSTDYRHASEHKFPAAHEDTFAAYQWLLANAASLKGDPAEIAVVGESAGGNMAAAIALQARDLGMPMPLRQVLIYPVAGHDFDTPSYRENANAKPLNRAMMQWFFEKYLSSPAAGDGPLIHLLGRTDLRGLPAATVITADIDPLRSDGKQYADHLKKAGVKVDYHNYPGVTHEFFGMGAVVAEARQAVQQVAKDLRQTFKH